MDFDLAVLVSLPALFFIFMVVEAAIPSGRDMPRIRLWRVIGVLALAATLIVNVAVPMVLVPYLPDFHIADLSGWELWAAGPAVVLTTFLTYWSHRLQHRFDLLWRLGHQLHHSVARVDIASAMVFHPIDIVVQIVMGLAAAMLLGITPHAAGIAGALGFAIALYQHWNVRTPAWTGWFIQRPEAHMRHHERDVHARNFGDMPVWDHLFGTYAAPADGPVALGFEPGRGRRVLAMIACVDVNQAKNRAKL